jgi:adenylate cyclase
MANEIERKFLVDKTKLDGVLKTNSGYLLTKQAYISTDPNHVVRVRAQKWASRGVYDGYSGYLTVKGKTTGITRKEYEFPILYKEAIELIYSEISATIPIVKSRFNIPGEDGKIWEVDIFHEENKGLIVAEIELKDENESFIKPDWITTEVSEDPKYSNLALALKPFKTW